MDFPAPHLYRQQASALGRDPHTVDRAIEVAQQVEAAGATPVFTLGHLAQVTGASPRYLRDVVSRKQDPYLSITRPKRNGTTRPISSPEPVLMDVQRWVLKYVLAASAPHDASFAYQSGCSIVQCAGRHIGARWLVKLDLHNFFGSIRERQIYPIFTDLGYPRLLSLELTRICTRSASAPVELRAGNKFKDKAPYSQKDEGRLPQGAPTSGVLANIVMREADAALTDLATEMRATYTRYSDDLTFSAGPDFSRDKATTLINRSARILGRHGFRLQRRKTRISPPGARHVVLGLLVDDKVRLLPVYKRRLETHVRGVSRFGLVEHVQFRNFDSVLSFINHIDGSIAFARDVEPEFATSLCARWEEALGRRGFPPKS